MIKEAAQKGTIQRPSKAIAATTSSSRRMSETNYQTSKMTRARGTRWFRSNSSWLKAGIQTAEHMPPKARKVAIEPTRHPADMKHTTELNRSQTVAPTVTYVAGNASEGFDGKHDAGGNGGRPAFSTEAEERNVEEARSRTQQGQCQEAAIHLSHRPLEQSSLDVCFDSSSSSSSSKRRCPH